MDDFTRGGNKKQSWPRGLDYTSLLLLLQQERKREMGMKVPKTHTLFAWGFLSTNFFWGGGYNSDFCFCFWASVGAQRRSQGKGDMNRIKGAKGIGKWESMKGERERGHMAQHTNVL